MMISHGIYAVFMAHLQFMPAWHMRSEKRERNLSAFI